MPFVEMPAQEGGDWSSESFFLQFFHAINERAAAAYISSLSLPTTGDDIQSSGVFYRMQSKLETVANHFINPALPEFSQANPPFWTWRWTDESWRSAAGLDPRGFTRKYPDANGATMISYGFARSGDYIGPWLFNEIKAGISVLTHRVMVPPLTVPPFGRPYPQPILLDENVKHGSGVVAADNDETSSSASGRARDLAETDFSVGGGGSEVLAGSTISSSGNDEKHFASLEKHIFTFSIPQPAESTAIPSDIEVYAYSRAASGNDPPNRVSAYEALGYPVQEDAWSLFVSGSPALVGGYYETAPVGDHSMPPWPTASVSIDVYGNPNNDAYAAFYNHKRGWTDYTIEDEYGDSRKSYIALIAYDFEY